MHTDLTTITLAELNADAKKIYNGGNLIELGDKYGVTTSSLTFWREHQDQLGARSLYVAAFGTKSTAKEMQSKLYATIKNLMKQQ